MMPRVNSLLLAARWLDRRESCRDNAARIASFLQAAGETDATLSTWLLEGLATSGAFRRADTSIRGIEELLRCGARDAHAVFAGRAAARGSGESGFSLALWNGLNASFQATVGELDRNNSAILSFQEAAPRDAATWRKLLSAAIEAFQPDLARVTSHAMFSRSGDASTGEWFSYRRGGPVTENPFSPDVC